MNRVYLQNKTLAMKLPALLALSLLAAPLMHAANTDLAASAVNQLGVDLHHRLAKSDANLCLSPLSIQIALAMTYAGADGETAAEMAKTLHYPKDNEPAVRESFQALVKGLDEARAKSQERASHSKQYGGPSEPIVFNLANRLFGQKGYAFRAPYLSELKDGYHSPFEELDFKTNTEASRKHINGWVEEETKKRIKDLIPSGALSPVTRLVLANALYLKAPWEKEFNDRATKPEPFHIHGKEPAEVPTMIQKAYYGYATENGYTAVTLPYSGGDLQFIILLPEKQTGLHDLEAKLTSAELAKCAKLEPREVILYLPKFKLESPSIALGEQLSALGMKTAFDQPRGSANFDKIAPRKPDDYLFISEVFHKTFIAVDEHGTEAAAATAVIMAAGSAFRPAQPPEIHVDHPFLFAIQHVPSGACLFIGRVTDPR